jgi:YD repeat-containing protein
MTVAGQPTVNYTWDNANRLTQITQGTATVTIGYDNSNRRTSLTLPNGVVAAYGYDAASRVTSVTYTLGQTTLGNLTYTYDANGRRTSMGGSLASVNLPAAVSCASQCYNANNQLTNWNGATLTYDLNGNLTNGSGDLRPYGLHLERWHGHHKSGDVLQWNYRQRKRDDAIPEYRVIHPKGRRANRPGRFEYRQQCGRSHLRQHVGRRIQL